MWKQKLLLFPEIYSRSSSTNPRLKWPISGTELVLGISPARIKIHKCYFAYFDCTVRKYWSHSDEFFRGWKFGLLTPWSRVLLEKLTVNFAASQEIPRIYGTRKFLTVSARAFTAAWYFLYPDCFVSRGSISTWVILNILFLQRVVVSTSSSPQAEGPPLVGCPRLLIQFIHSYPPYRRPFGYPCCMV
jgi:hypothetical protein